MKTLAALWFVGLATLAAPRALAHQPADPPPVPQTLLVFEAGSVDDFLVSPKDARLKATVQRLPDRLRAWRQRIPDLQRLPESGMELALSVLAMPKRLAVTDRGFDPATGLPGLGIAVLLTADNEQQAKGIAGQVEALRAEVAPRFQSSPSRRFEGLRDLPLPFGVLSYGAVREGDAWQFRVLFGQANDAIEAINALPRPAPGLRIAARATADMAAWTPLTSMLAGFASMAAQPGMPNPAENFAAMGLIGPDAIKIDALIAHTEDQLIRRQTIRGMGPYAEAWGRPKRSFADTDLAAIPADASAVFVQTFDPQAWWASLKQRTVALGDPEQFNQILENFRTQTGIDVERDVIDLLGDVLTIYFADSTGGGSVLSGVAMITISDPARLIRALRSASDRLNARIRDESPVGQIVGIGVFERDGHVFFQSRSGGLPLGFEPTLAVVGQRLIIGATPQAAHAAASQARPGQSRGLLENARFRGATWGTPPASVLFFVDSERTARDGYGIVNLGAQALAGAARLDAVNDDPFDDPMPAFGALLNGSRPALSLSYWDGEDFVTEARTDQSMLVNLAAILGIGDAAPLLTGFILGAATAAGIQEQMERSGLGRGLGEPQWELEEEWEDEEEDQAPQPQPRERRRF